MLFIDGGGRKWNNTEEAELVSTWDMEVYYMYICKVWR